MAKRSVFNAKLKSRQQGAVAIIVALCLVVLVGMMGLVLDLGHLYVTKTELQNAADAAALSGAKELNKTLAGVNNARDRAIEAAKRNKYNLNATAVTLIASDDLWVGSCPDDGTCTMVRINTVTTNAAAADKTFLKVDTGSKSLSTWFIHVLPGVLNRTATFGMAVAGRYVVNIAPIGMCAIDPANSTLNNNGELLEYGYRRGMGYNILAINNAKGGLVGLSQVPLWINPIDVYPNACNPSNSSDSTLRPFICAGESSSIFEGGTVYINTGVQASQERFLNSRFDNSQSFGNNKCDATLNPPDSNIKQYIAPGPGGAVPTCPSSSTNVNCGLPRDWTDPSSNVQPALQTVRLNTVAPNIGKPMGYPNVPTNTADLGALWSFSRAVRYDGSVSGNVGTAFGINDWGPAGVASGGANLYKLDADTTTSGYPASAGSGFPVGTLAAPYNQTSGKYYQTPTNYPPGLSGRRVMNVALINCDAAPGGSGACRTMPVLAIAKVFMTVEANFSGSPGKFETEFAGIVNTGQVPRDVRLYR